MHFTYYPKGVCSVQIDFDLDDEDKISNLKFIGGCNGNLKAISRLVEGENAEKVSSILIGNICNSKNTSCSDQLAKALIEAKEKNHAK